MREILFRGKRVNNGEWIYGYFVNQYGANEIYLPDGTDNEGVDRYFVDHETVGRWSGFTDIHGVKIFEGDILRDIRHGYIVRVEYQLGSFFLPELFTDLGSAMFDYSFEIIGNVYDNSELIGGAT